MRTNPSAVVASGTDYYRFYRNSTFDSFNNLTRDANFSSTGAVNSIKLYNSSEISGTAGHAGTILTANASCSIAFDAEL
jgi:S-formylglutathione hydrolase FrmB